MKYKEYPKVLVLTRNAWNNSNCTGNTLSNFFANWPKERIANAFFRSESIGNSVCECYYRVTEQDLIRSIKSKKHQPGSVIDYDCEEVYQKDAVPESVDFDVAQSKKVYNFFGKHRFIIALWMRDLLWSLGKWDNSKFDDFLRDFHPQVIYMPCYDSVYMHRILWYVKEKTGAGIVLFTGDDTYTFKQFNLSPIYWINRLVDRATMRKSVQLADALFVISDKQKAEYDKIFGRECVLLRKGGDFSKGFLPKPHIDHPVKLVYTGNIHAGRWKTLAELVNVIKRLNKHEQRIELDIYTLSPRTNEIMTKLNVDGCSRLMPPATDREIKNAIESSDALIFVEPFQLKEKLKWRLSFSTKIVDYLAASRAIIAIGPRGLASMDYLFSNDAAICINRKEQMFDCIKDIIEHPDILFKYAENAWKCGSKNNDISGTQEILLSALSNASHIKHETNMTK